MKYYIAFDGGGTKLQGVLFDETYTVLAFGLSGGVNGTVHTAAEADRHIEECLWECSSAQASQSERLRFYSLRRTVSGMSARFAGMFGANVFSPLEREVSAYWSAGLTPASARFPVPEARCSMCATE